MAPKKAFPRTKPDLSSQHRLGSVSSSEDSLNAPSGSSHRSSIQARNHHSVAAPRQLSPAQAKDLVARSHLGAGPSTQVDTASIMRNPPAPVEVPITYTPTTGRVSKAKKGKRVHACEFPGCGKVFTRAEHRRRHQLNHNPEHSFPCKRPGCGKAFHRLDLLQRHEERQ